MKIPNPHGKTVLKLIVGMVEQARGWRQSLQLPTKARILLRKIGRRAVRQLRRPLSQKENRLQMSMTKIVSTSTGARMNTIGMLIQLPIDDFHRTLSSKSPGPGGGSVAALSGALAAGLISKVCNLSIGKEGYETFHVPPVLVICSNEPSLVSPSAKVLVASRPILPE